MRRCPQPRIWTEIAEDVGQVLRRQLVESRSRRATQPQRREAARRLVRSIVQQKVAGPLEAAAKRVYLMGNLPRAKEQRLPGFDSQSAVDKLKSMRGYYQEKAFQGEGSRSRSLQDSRRRDAEMMRTYLHKLKFEDSARRLYQQKEKRYRVWRTKLGKNQCSTLPHSFLGQT